MTGMVASDYEGVKEVARCEKGDRGGHMAEDNGRKGERRKIMDSLFGERLTWEEAGHVASNEWMMRRREDHADREGRRMDDTRQQEKGGKEDDMMGEGPTQAKHRAAENDRIA
jgi:hypothetical protein